MLCRDGAIDRRRAHRDRERTVFYRHVQGVLSPDECQAIVDQGSALGFEPAAVNVYGEQKLMASVRNNERVEFDDAALALWLQGRLQAAMGADFPDQFEDKRFVKAAAHLRMYRYVPGQYFKPHRDGSFHDGQFASEITVLFYLNDPDSGGETVLMPHGPGQAWAFIAIAPRAGDVLIFEHHVFHEGRQVGSGEKLVLRTDLFYR